MEPEEKKHTKWIQFFQSQSTDPLTWTLICFLRCTLRWSMAAKNTTVDRVEFGCYTAPFNNMRILMNAVQSTVLIFFAAVSLTRQFAMADNVPPLQALTEDDPLHIILDELGSPGKQLSYSMNATICLSLTNRWDHSKGMQYLPVRVIMCFCVCISLVCMHIPPCLLACPCASLHRNWEDDTTLPSRSQLTFAPFKHKKIGFMAEICWQGEPGDFYPRKTLSTSKARYLCAASWNSIITSSNLPIAWSTKQLSCTWWEFSLLEFKF